MLRHFSSLESACVFIQSVQQKISDGLEPTDQIFNMVQDLYEQVQCIPLQSESMDGYMERREMFQEITAEMLSELESELSALQLE